MLDGVTAVYRSNVDLFFYVIGAQTENEVSARCLCLQVSCCNGDFLPQLLLLNVLTGLYDTLSQVLK